MTGYKSQDLCLREGIWDKLGQPFATRTKQILMNFKHIELFRSQEIAQIEAALRFGTSTFLFLLLWLYDNFLISSSVPMISLHTGKGTLEYAMSYNEVTLLTGYIHTTIVNIVGVLFL